MPRGFPDHSFCFAADSQDLPGPLVHRDDGRLIDDDAFAAHVDERVGRPEIDADILGKMPEKTLDNAFLKTL